MAKLLEVLRDLNVQYVLVGSVAASVYGAEVNPGDLDIVPELHPENLDRLVEALRDVEAVPRGPFGNWTHLGTGEWKWIPEPTTDEELGEWKPDVRDVHSFDNLFLTRLGNFDVVPEIAGPYETLRRRAILRSCYGCDIYVAHVDDLLARLTVPRREKDRDRVAALRQIQRQQAEK